MYYFFHIKNLNLLSPKKLSDTSYIYIKLSELQREQNAYACKTKRLSESEKIT